MNITDGTDHGNGSYSHNNHLYNNESYGYTDKIMLHNGTFITVKEHLRGCICGLKGAKPCLPFCCPENYVSHLVGNQSNECIPFDHELIVNSTNDEGFKEINVKNNYIPIHFKCKEYYVLDKSDDIWKLHKVRRSHIKLYLFSI